MKYILLGICALGLTLGALSGPSSSLESITAQNPVGQGLANYAPPTGFCHLSPDRPREFELIEANSRDAKAGGLRHLASFMACEELDAWRAGAGAVLRMGSYLQLPRNAGDWGFAASDLDGWSGGALHAALNKGMAEVLSGGLGGDLGVQTRIGPARYRTALEPVSIPELDLEFVGVTLVGQMDASDETPAVVILLNAPYQSPSQVLGLLELEREAFAAIQARQDEQRLARLAD